MRRNALLLLMLLIQHMPAATYLLDGKTCVAIRARERLRYAPFTYRRDRKPHDHASFPSFTDSASLLK